MCCFFLKKLFVICLQCVVWGFVSHGFLWLMAYFAGLHFVRLISKSLLFFFFFFSLTSFVLGTEKLPESTMEKHCQSCRDVCVVSLLWTTGKSIELWACIHMRGLKVPPKSISQTFYYHHETPPKQSRFPQDLRHLPVCPLDLHSVAFQWCSRLNSAANS